MNGDSCKWAPLPLRLMIGFGFMYHGFPKLFTADGHGVFVGMLQNLGVPAPVVAAWGVAVVEFVGGVALVLGAFVSVAALLLIIEMLVAMFKVHLAAGFNFVHITGMTDAGPKFGLPGYEVNLLYIAGLLALLIFGASALSVDKLRSRRR
jgi:putative oxidoreductase